MKKRRKPWQLIAITALVVLFGVRMYVAKLNRDKQRPQQQMIRDLARQ